MEVVIIELYLFIIALVCILSVISIQFMNKIGIPSLLIFIGIGLLFGSDGILKISFDDYHMTQDIANIALTFIMFYGGFCTNWKAAKPVAVSSIMLSTIGVILTAGLTGLFCFYVLNTSLLEGLLIGSVLASTDAASVFSILRTKKLNLKDGLASLLEIESGSNDPIAYLLTTVILGIMSHDSQFSIPVILFQQVVFGIVCGAFVGLASSYILKRYRFHKNGMHFILLFAIALSSYAIPTLIGGNGFLSVYIAGIILGNNPIQDKIELIHFFDGVTSIMQILLFFSLGLLAFPSQLPSILLPATLITLFLTFIARPIAVYLVLLPFHVPLKHQLLVSWAGLRGAASIVFAILTVVSSAYTNYDIFHIAFFVCIVSVSLQGSLLPYVSKKLDLLENEDNLSKTFNDYQDTTKFQLVEFHIDKNHKWCHHYIHEIEVPQDMLIVMIKRNHQIIIPRGDTFILENDDLILSCQSYDDSSHIELDEIILYKHHSWIHKKIKDIKLHHQLIVMIQRQDQCIIPNGQTVLEQGDILVVYENG